MDTLTPSTHFLQKGFALLLLMVGLIPMAGAFANEDHFVVTVELDAAGDNLNAFGGTLHFPSDWTMERVELHSPALLYWVETPSIQLDDALSFSGILPGGLQTLSSGDDQLSLFSIEFSGQSSEIDQLFFDPTEFYLNHPTALPAPAAQFEFELNMTSLESPLQTGLSLANLQFSFEKDPVGDIPMLVLDTTRGQWANYSFAVREGDFGGEWIPMDSVYPLNFTWSTVALSMTAPDGQSQTFLLRISPLRYGLYGVGVFIFVAFMVFLGYRTVRILRFNPDRLN